MNRVASGGVGVNMPEQHRDNKRLRELILSDPSYAVYFKFSILEEIPIMRDKHSILAYEQSYKRKLYCVLFGLNENWICLLHIIPFGSRE